MATANNPATADQDMAGFRARNAAASAADGDYVRRGELEAAVINALTSAYLASITTKFQPIGALLYTLEPTAPDSTWLPVAGGTYSRTTYATLWNRIKLNPGVGAGDGSTTFTLPDYRDKFLLAAGTAHTLAATGGAETVTLDATQIPAHSHGITLSATQTGGTPSFNFDVSASSPTASNSSTTSVGGGAAHDNMPPYAAVNVFVKALYS
ncbi:MAG: tail fiber protein [Planctomycetes bacterium]|nr:tail fiber protein [Planctomycetota bacterium]